MASLGIAPAIHREARVSASKLGRYTEVAARTSFVESELGDYSYVMDDSDVIYTSIGKFCSIASHTRINPGNHPMQRASQSHFTYRASAYFEGEADDAAFFDWRRAHRVTIGHDVWIGHGAIILPGRNVGDGAVVAAGAIVTRDVAPYAIVAGNAARVIRPRFDADCARRLQELAWWDWDHGKLKAALPQFRSMTVQAFLDHCGA